MQVEFKPGQKIGPFVIDAVVHKGERQREYGLGKAYEVEVDVELGKEVIVEDFGGWLEMTAIDEAVLRVDGYELNWIMPTDLQDPNKGVKMLYTRTNVA